ncbi:TolC family protein [Gangjinia marincola]|uniref:TolC family protein n=1 Tax=Gangjinia marincola TaxID=578463 RepID=A0ABP3XVB8_9FLAO
MTCNTLAAQEVIAVADTTVLSYNEYLGLVKEFHPVAKQAALILNQAEANLLKSRGSFDPKIDVDYSRKKFKNTEYYDILNATFKIPTWYGIELKAQFEENEGVFLNPQLDVPQEGLYNAGISFSALEGFLINDRMATLKQAKIMREQSKADRDLAVNKILFEASLTYFDWVRTYSQVLVFDNFVENAQIRFEGIKSSALAGDRPIIDTLEAKITVQNRFLELEKARIRFVKASLALSNYLWLADNLPVELQPGVVPDIFISEEIDTSLEIAGRPLSDFNIENHPKLLSLQFKLDQLNVDRRLKANKLLPTLDLEYNFLSQTPEETQSFNTANYKSGFVFSVPLFLRKERGDLKLAKIKVQDAELDLSLAEITIKNDILGIYQELDSYVLQNDLILNIVDNYSRLVAAEERKFSFGESSLFLVNTREQKLIESKLKQIDQQNKFYEAKAKLFKSLAINPENL